MAVLLSLHLCCKEESPERPCFKPEKIRATMILKLTGFTEEPGKATGLALGAGLSLDPAE